MQTSQYSWLDYIVVTAVAVFFIIASLALRGVIIYIYLKERFEGKKI